MFGIEGFVNPVEGKFRITSNHGARKSQRTTNGKRSSHMHYGVDYAGEKAGDMPNIRSVNDSEVVWTGNAGGYGNTVVTKLPDGTYVQYAHLNSFNVKKGDKLKAGQTLGVMGATGDVTGVHLDMRVISKDGNYIGQDGAAIGKVPDGFFARIGGKPTPAVDPSKSPMDIKNIRNNPQLDAPMFQISPSVGGDVFAKTSKQDTPTTILQGGIGLAIPETPTQNALFSQIASLGLDPEIEGIYAEAAKGLANAKDRINSKPMIQSYNPLRDELSDLFDNIEA